MSKLFSKIAMLVIILAMVSCNDIEDGVAIDNIAAEQINPPVRATEEGYLHFDSQQTFDEFYQKAKASLNTNVESRAASLSGICIPGFTSINDINSKLKNQISSRSNPEIINEQVEEDDFDCEEGTEEECRLAIVNELIPDESLQCLLDTTLRIEIGDTYYRVTYNGTLYAKIEYKEKVDSVAANFPTDLRAPMHKDTYQAGPNVYAVDTYSRMESGRTVVDAGDWATMTSLFNPGNKPVIPPTTTNPTNPSYHNDKYYWGSEDENTRFYSLRNRTWDAKTVLGDFLEWISGNKDIREDNKFDNNHRVQCKLFDLNYVFYDGAGFRVDLQKRKKFLFVTYWVSCGGAEDLVIGFEDFQGEVSIEHPISITNPVAYYTSNLNGAVNNMVYAGLCKPTLVENWLKDYIPCLYHGVIIDNLREWGMDPSKYTDHVTKNLVEMGVNSLFGKTLEGMKDALKKGDPLLNINPYAKDKYEFWIYGINGWKNTNSKKITFGKSYGFSFPDIWSGWTPEKYKILRPQMFGAIKYNGQWRGVRFTE